MISRGVFGAASSFDDRAFFDLEKLGTFVEHARGIGLKIVLTSGSFDLIHIGHAAYLEKAKQNGDLLIVGVDSDEKIRERKGPDRPIVPEDERMRMLSYLRPVDVIYLKTRNDPKWSLIRTVKPDVLIATEKTYEQAQIDELESNYCGEVKVLEPQATTTTSARLRLVQLGLTEKITAELNERFPKVVSEVVHHVLDPGKRS